MEEQDLVLLRWSDACPSNNLSLADQILGMQFNDIAGIHSDFRSPSRAVHQHLRKRRRPKHRQKCVQRSCPVCWHPELASRRRRREKWMGECSEEAYWDELSAEGEHRERIEYRDPMQMYHDHEHNAAALKSLLPYSVAADDEEELEKDNQDWIYVQPPTDCHEMPKTTSLSRMLSLYRRHTLSSPSPSPSPQCLHTFTWHCNANANWELSYANPHSRNISSHKSGMHPCSCTESPQWWESTQETWRGYLLDWMDGNSCDEMTYADARQNSIRETMRERENEAQRAGVYLLGSKAQQGTNGFTRDREEWTFVRSRAPGDADWDMVSVPSSTGSWRLVDVG